MSVGRGSREPEARKTVLRRSATASLLLSAAPEARAADRPSDAAELVPQTANASADGAWLVTGSGQKTAQLWDLHSGTKIVGASRDGTARLWDLASGPETASLWLIRAALNAPRRGSR